MHQRHNLLVNTVSTKKEKIQYAIQHNPLLIPVLLRDTSINKGFLYRELANALPCRVGIEFELAGNFGKSFCKKYNIKENLEIPVNCPSIKYSPSEVDKEMMKFYKVLEICSDSDHWLKSDDIYEIRISLSDFHQLGGLYKFMQDLSEFCKLHENGGIHIHLDMSMYKLNGCTKTLEVKQYIEHRLDEIGEIFPKYTGTYNLKSVGVIEKRTWVNISRLNTLEFRIAPLTFDYNTLMNWILKLVKFRQNLIHKCRLIKNYQSKNPRHSTILSPGIAYPELEVQQCPPSSYTDNPQYYSRIDLATTTSPAHMWTY